VMPDFDKITKEAALPRLTGAWLDAALAVMPEPTVSITANIVITKMRTVLRSGWNVDLFMVLSPL
jgi:hypothetical protein